MTDKKEVELRELAESATPGPWRACGSDRGGCVCGQVWSTAIDHPVASTNVDSPEEGISTTKEVKVRDAAYIAAASPDYILELLTKISQLEQLLNLPDENDPLVVKMVDSATFDPEHQRAKAGGTIGDWMRRAESTEAKVKELEQQLVDATEKRDRLRCALDRLLNNAKHIFNKVPVRDWAETLAEADYALALSTPDVAERGN